MAKKTSNVITRLLSTAGTGYCYYTKRNTRNSTEKFSMKKYDPIVRKHVLFKEAKLPSPSRK
jgi:large subunit ribosomal protein L33